MDLSALLRTSLLSACMLGRAVIAAPQEPLPSSPSGRPSGRYQIFFGKTAFLVDTDTGRVWGLSGEGRQSGFEEIWVEKEDNVKYKQQLQQRNRARIAHLKDEITRSDIQKKWTERLQALADRRGYALTLSEEPHFNEPQFSGEGMAPLSPAEQKSMDNARLKLLKSLREEDPKKFDQWGSMIDEINGLGPRK